MNSVDLSWWEEKVEKTPTKNWLYKIICFLLAGNKLSYRELYVILLEINNGNTTDESSKPIKQKCFERILDIYKFNNNKLPKEMEEYVK